MQFLRVRIQNAASDRSIPPKLPIFTGQPKWHCDRSILNAKTKNEFVFLTSLLKTKNEFVFLTSLLKTKNEKGIRFSFANLKTKNEKGIRYPFFIRKFENKKGKNGIYTDPPRSSSSYQQCPTWLSETWGVASTYSPDRALTYSTSHTSERRPRLLEY